MGKKKKKQNNKKQDTEIYKRESKKTEHIDEQENTAIYKPVKEKKKGKKKKHRKLKLFLKIMFIIFLLLVMIGAGIFGAILYRCIWGDWGIKKEDLAISFQNSVIYDKNGNVIGNLTGNENREIISKDEMSPYLSKAFISIEDERFESHNGVDWKRTLGALVTFAANRGESSYGGSTITQQIVKNITGDDERSAIEGALRKVKEIVRAYQVETILSKDQIIELYMNLIPLGGGAKNIYGVQTAARYYFNKNAKDLTLVESAYIAGITNKPNAYNPFGTKPYNHEEQNEKAKTVEKRVTDVLWKMHELGKITKEEYDSALEEVNAGIKFEEGTVSQNNNLPYHTEAAIKQIRSELMEKYNWSKDEAELHLYGDGYQIYTTYDPNIQSAVDKQYINNSASFTTKYKTVKRGKNEDGTDITEQVRQESAIVIIDYKTGQVVAGTSGFGEKTQAWGKNRMTDDIHSPGSSIKPLAVIRTKPRRKVNYSRNSSR